MEQQLPADLGERQVAELVEDHEVETGQEVGEASLTSSAALSLEAVDQVDGVEEAPARSGTDAASRDRDGQVRFAGTGSADQGRVTLLRDEVAAGEIAHQALVDRRSLEGEVVEILGERQLGDSHLAPDRACLLLGHLGLEQVADEALRFVLALDRRGQGLVTGAPHAEELQRAHHVEDFGPLHAHRLLS